MQFLNSICVYYCCLSEAGGLVGHVIFFASMGETEMMYFLILFLLSLYFMTFGFIHNIKSQQTTYNNHVSDMTYVC